MTSRVIMITMDGENRQAHVQVGVLVVDSPAAGQRQAQGWLVQW